MRRQVWVATILVVAPLLALALRLLFGSARIFPISDIALIELGVRDVGRHAVLTGVYSRFKWHHPGPALFYTLALPYRAFGSSSEAMYAGAALGNAISIAAIAVVAARRGGARFALWTLAVLSIYLAAISPASFASPWNPLVPLLPFILLVLLAWSLGTGDVVMLPFVAGVGTFVVQAHVGYVAGVGVVVLAGLISALTRGIPRARWVRMGTVAALVLGVLWLPPVVDQFSKHGDNLHQLASWLVHSHRGYTLGRTVPIVVRELGAIPARAAGFAHHVRSSALGGPRNAPVAAGVLTMVAMIAAAGLAWRRRRDDPGTRDALLLFAMTGLLIVVAAAALTRVVGPLFDYLTIWVSTIGVLGVIAIGMVVVSPARARAPWVTGVLLAVIAVASIGNTIAAITTDTPATYLSSPHAVTFTDAVEGALPPPPARRAVHFSTATRDVWPWMVGVTLQLERRGIPVTIDGWEFMVGARRTAASPPRGSTAFTFAGTADADRLRRDPRWREVQTIGDVSLFARA